MRLFTKRSELELLLSAIGYLSRLSIIFLAELMLDVLKFLAF